MPLSSRFTLRAYALHSQTVPVNDLGTGSAGQVLIDQLLDFTLTDGTVAGSADRIFSDNRTIAASGTDDLDLAGVLTDSFGVTVTFARVKALYIAAAQANTNNVVVGAAASNQWATLFNATGTQQFRPGQRQLAAVSSQDAVGWAVTAGTGDILRIANGGAGTSVTYDIIIVGCSA